VDLGYDRENVLLFSANAKLAGYTSDRAAALYRDLLERLEALPHVSSVSMSRVRPADNEAYLIDRINEVDGRKLSDRDSIRIAFNAVGPGYFSNLGTPLLLGREFDARDNAAAPKVVIVNESLARRALPGQSPLGHRLGDAAIVGVVKDSVYGGAREQPRPVLYWALFQSELDSDVSFQVRHRGASTLEEVRRAVASVDRNLAVFRVNTLRAQTENPLLRERLLAMLSGSFGVLALVLACIGLYGLMAYAVARRTGEIGIRMALGAGRGDIVWGVLRETLLLALAGIAFGVPVALWAARYTRTLLFGVRAADPLTIAAAAAALLGVAALAGYLPARRALRVEPTVALRQE
jgi:predicted permease